MATDPDLDVDFIEYAQAQALPGVYRFTSQQLLKYGPGDREGERLDTPDSLEDVEDTFQVDAARFVLDAAAIHAHYPLRGASGDYELVLPHITLKRSLLPWDRHISGQRRTDFQPRDPWLALLVFRAEELPDHLGGEPVTRPVSELIHPKEADILGPDLVIGTQWNKGSVAFEPVPPDSADDDCQTIDVPVETFTAIAPRQDELPFLVHVRDVHRPRAFAEDAEILTEGMYAVVSANRFPDAPDPTTPGTIPYTAHLVSLEGHQDHLPGGTNLPGETTRVRLCSLASWPFTLTVGNLDIVRLLENLVAPSRSDVPDAAENLSLRLPLQPPDHAPDLAARSAPGHGQRHDAAQPPADADTTADEDAEGREPSAAEDESEYLASRLRRGYVPIPHSLASGELTFAWYRGPATPVTTPAIQVGPEQWPYPPGPGEGGPPTTADHALVYEEEHGIFDVSYAAAWTLGRALALADTNHAQELVRARRELANRYMTLAALSGDPARSHAEPDALPGQYALQQLSSPGFARTLLQALNDPPAGDVPPTVSAVGAMDRESVRTRLAELRWRTLLETTADRHAAVLAEWTDRLAHLHDVPLHYLLPHPALLPPESLRMFRIDSTWIDALVAGATDAGIHTTVDRHVAPALHSAVSRARSNGSAPLTAGIFIRSALVEAWPDFDLTAWIVENPGESDPEKISHRKVDELRREHSAADTLLCLFAEVPEEIVIREPGQGVHMGISRADRREVINLRRLQAEAGSHPDEGLGSSTGVPFPAQGQGSFFTRHMREASPSPRRVLNLRGTGAMILTDLAQALNRTDIRPDELALQLINSPIRQQLLSRNSLVAGSVESA
ncbi:hypothetical protein [Streptomyces sp. x-19]|uniref:hypothetical protein n=1 Tax=Streptomyces sp. x-19 TaxID=2789280 RepID=UPI003980D3A2